MKITRAWLEERRACPDQVAVFAREWPKGAELNEANIRRALELHLDLSWLAERVLTAEPSRLYCEATAEADRLYCEATAEADRLYCEATAERSRLYDEATAEPSRLYDEATAEADRLYHEATAEADRLYHEARATAFVQALQAQETTP